MSLVDYDVLSLCIHELTGKSMKNVNYGTWYRHVGLRLFLFPSTLKSPSPDTDANPGEILRQRRPPREDNIKMIEC